MIDDLGADAFEPGDVVVHNDPYRGGSHMPEHLLITPFFHGRRVQGWVCNIAHVAEIGGMAPGLVLRRTRRRSTRRVCGSRP